MIARLAAWVATVGIGLVFAIPRPKRRPRLMWLRKRWMVSAMDSLGVRPVAYCWTRRGAEDQRKYCELVAQVTSDYFPHLYGNTTYHVHPRERVERTWPPTQSTT